MEIVISKEANLAKFHKHFNHDIPIAIISPIFTFQGKRQSHTSGKQITQAKAHDIFEKNKHKIRAFGFGFIEGKGRYFHQTIGRYAEMPCFIMYGTPIENTNQFYDGTIKPAPPEFKITAGYTRTEAEAQLKQLAILFGKQFGLETCLFISIDGGASINYLNDIEEVVSYHNFEPEKLLHKGGEEEPAGKVQLKLQDNGISTTLKGNKFSCQFQNFDIDIKESSRLRVLGGELFWKVRNREILFSVYKDYPEKYFPCKIKQYPLDFIRTFVKKYPEDYGICKNKIKNKDLDSIGMQLKIARWRY